MSLSKNNRELFIFILYIVYNNKLSQNNESQNTNNKIFFEILS